MFKGNRGFTILEVLISCAIMAVVTLGIMSLGNVSMKGNQTTQNQIEFGVLQNSLKMILNADKLCSTAFLDASNSPLTYIPPAPPGSVAISTINFGSSPLTSVGANVGSGLKISEIALVPSSVTPDTIVVNETPTGAPTLKTYDRFFASLHLKATKASETFGGKTLDNDANRPTLTLLVDQAPPHAIKHCYSEVSPQGVCDSMHGTFDASSGKCHMTQSFNVTLAQLAYCHPTVASVSNSHCGATPVPLNGDDMFVLIAACNRFCSTGTSPANTNCPGKGFTGGTVGECNCLASPAPGLPAAPEARCNCIN